VIPTVLVGVVVVLTLNVLACLVRVLRGPGGSDRLLGVVLAGTTGAAALATLSVVSGEAALRDAALVVVALAVVVTVSRIEARGTGRR
jgi:multicomponent Na+:H+ antiporter subunit F